MVFWCFGVFVFWLKFKSQVNGLACGFVMRVVSSFGRLVFSLDTVIFPVPGDEFPDSFFHGDRRLVSDSLLQTCH